MMKLLFTLPLLFVLMSLGSESIPIIEIEHDPSLQVVPEEVIKNFQYMRTEKYKNTTYNSWLIRAILGMSVNFDQQVEHDRNQVFNMLVSAGFIGHLHLREKLLADPNLKNSLEYKNYIVKFDSNNTKLLNANGKEQDKCWWSNTTSSCPHHLETRLRKDRIPEIVSVAICTCKDCLPTKLTHSSGGDLLTSCQPVYTYEPTLVQTGDKWRVAMEERPFSCECRRNRSLETVTPQYEEY